MSATSSTEEVRLVLEPKSRTVDPILLMEQMFKLTELETRLPLNMNVLSRGLVPNVLSLRQVLREWLDHRKEVLVRGSKHRLAKIDHRLEVLEGFLIVYLNLDKVIKIIRETEEPKPALMRAFKLTDVQAEAILNMRLRSLRKLEEMEIRREHETLTKERKELKALLASDDKQWKRIGDDIKELKERFGQKTELGRRRTSFDVAPEGVEAELAEVMIEKEPVTVVLSEKGWIRAMRGHQTELDSLTFKEGDRLKRAVRAQTTDTLLLFATNGRFYTLSPDKLPSGRGHGEPFRLMIDIEETADAVELFLHEAGRKLLVASSSGHGFIVPEDEVVGVDPQGQAGAERGRERGGGDLRPRRRRQRRGHRRQPQAPAVPAEGVAGDAARQGRAAATLQGWRARRRQDLQEEGRPRLYRLRRPDASR